MRGFWQLMLTLFWDVRSLLGIREEALFVMNLYYVGKSAHETLLTSRSQLKATFLVDGCKKKRKKCFIQVDFFHVNRIIPDDPKNRSHKIQ